MEVTTKIAERIGIEPDDITISKISEHVENPQKEELVEIAHVLTQIHEDINHKKITNTMLIKQGAMLVENNIRFILKALGKENMLEDTYSSNADAPKFSGSVHIDGRM